MQIRCTACAHSFALTPGGTTGMAKCGNCGKAHHIHARRDAITDPEAHMEAVRQLAEVSGLDEATASSVLLGLISLSAAGELAEKGKQHSGASSAETGGSRAKRRGADSKAARGNAKKPSRKKNEPRIVATHTEDPEETRSHASMIYALLGIVAVAGVLTLYASKNWKQEVARTEQIALQAQERNDALSESALEQETAEATPAHLTQEPPEDPRLEFVKLRWDRSDRLTHVAAPNPEAALVAFCRNYENAAYCTPVELTSLNPPQIGVRLGVFRDLSQAHTLRAVRVERDRVLRKWVVGSGRAPIDHFEVDSAMMGDERMRVDPYVR